MLIDAEHGAVIEGPTQIMFGIPFEKCLIVARNDKEACEKVDAFIKNKGYSRLNEIIYDKPHREEGKKIFYFAVYKNNK